jgi:hypothetical protein
MHRIVFGVKPVPGCVGLQAARRWRRGFKTARGGRGVCELVAGRPTRHTTNQRAKYPAGRPGNL